MLLLLGCSPPPAAVEQDLSPPPGYVATRSGADMTAARRRLDASLADSPDKPKPGQTWYRAWPADPAADPSILPDGAAAPGSETRSPPESAPSVLVPSDPTRSGGGTGTRSAGRPRSVDGWLVGPTPPARTPARPENAPSQPAPSVADIFLAPDAVDPGPATSRRGGATRRDPMRPGPPPADPHAATGQESAFAPVETAPAAPEGEAEPAEQLATSGSGSDADALLAGVPLPDLDLALAESSPLLADPAQSEAAQATIALKDNVLRIVEDASLSATERGSALSDLLMRRVNVEALARYAAGRHWRAAPEPVRQTYMRLFADLMVQIYGDRLQQVGRYDLKILDSYRESLGRETVEMVAETEDGDAVEIEWLLRRIDGTLKVEDIIVAGISFRDTQRDELRTVFEDGGDLNGAVAVLRRKVAEETEPAD